MSSPMGADQSELNWNEFGQLYARATLRMGHVEEALKAFQWTGVACRGRDDYGMTHALQGLIDLKHGDLAGAQIEVVNFEGFIGNPHIGMPAPLSTTKAGVAALCYLGIDCFGSVYQDYALEAQYDALAVKNAPENLFCIIQEAHSQGMLLNFQKAVTLLENASKRLKGADQWTVNWYLAGYRQLEAKAEAQKDLGIKPKTGGVKP